MKHVNSSKRSTTYFHNAIRKYGVDAFIWEILKTCKDATEMDQEEAQQILIHKSYDKRFGYNLTFGFDGLSFPTIATKEKMRDSHLGRPNTEEQKQKISAALKGRKISDETRQKLRDAKLGKKFPPLSAEHKEKLRDAQLGKKHNVSPEGRHRISENMKHNNPMKKIQKQQTL